MQVAIGTTTLTPTPSPLLQPTHTTASSHLPQSKLQEKKLVLVGCRGVPAREGPLSYSIRKGGTAGRSPPPTLSPFQLPAGLSVSV